MPIDFDDLSDVRKGREAIGMADRACNYCNDNGDCDRCSPFFEPEKVHSKCGHKWKEHKYHAQPASNQGIYPGWSTCPTAGAEGRQ